MAHESLRSYYWYCYVCTFNRPSQTPRAEMKESGVPWQRNGFLVLDVATYVLPDAAAGQSQEVRAGLERRRRELTTVRPMMQLVHKNQLDQPAVSSFAIQNSLATTRQLRSDNTSFGRCCASAGLASKLPHHGCYVWCSCWPTFSS